MLLPYAGQYILMLEEETSARLIPIWIGMAEGNAIAFKMNNDKFPRPCTHDLITSILGVVGWKVKKVTVTDLRANTYYAVISIEKDGHVVDVDSRPSDALALAIRVDAPIFLSDEVMEKCPVIKKPISESEVETFKNMLENVKSDELFEELEKLSAQDDDDENQV